MKKFSEYLENLMTTSSTGLSQTPNYIGTLPKRKKKKKKTLFGKYIQSRRIAGFKNGKYIFTPAYEEKEN